MSRFFGRKKPPSSPAAPVPTEEILRLPCCAHKIGVDLDTPVGAEMTCLFCGARLILRGRPGTTARHLEIKREAITLPNGTKVELGERHAAPLFEE